MSLPLSIAARPLEPFGLEIERDLARPLSPEDEAELRQLLATHKLLLFRRQSLSEADQVRVMGALGRVLGARGEYREISSDGNLGAGPLAYHSDLAFTDEPFKVLSLHALEVNDNESWTSFANGVTVLGKLGPQLRAAVQHHEALTVISVVQSHRDVEFDPAPFLPQQRRPVVIPHPATGEPVLYISEMQTARIEGLDQAASEQLLQQLFAALYAPENVYRHYWRRGDLVIWDNIALQHARCDLTGMHPRRLQRVAIADKSFFELCPQFDLSDPRIAAWASGQRLQVEKEGEIR
ncbi:MAG TPA: TauD/TfdA family dioxygenase [Pedomonas sp.]|uniref:TauD/TfdA dioxygenase family protein n=1 Tax=Pedomonas sp. TaxID=2976421 RepID=UPI002F41FA61